MRIVISDTVKDVCQALTESLINVLHTIQNREVFLAISGGNTPLKLFDLWSHRYEHTIDWRRIQLFWVDERCVPPSDKESNYHMAVKHLIEKLPFMEKHIHRIHGEAVPQEEALRYGEVVRKLLPWNHDVPVFDIIILGIGGDGHTASLFPPFDNNSNKPTNNICMTETKSCYNSDDYQHQKSIYIVSTQPQTGQERVTMTLQLINNAHNIFFLATGEEKSRVISDIFHQTAQAQLYPANYVKPIEGNLICFLDRMAASKACIYAE